MTNDSTPGTPAPDSGARDQGPTRANEPELQAAARRDGGEVDDDTMLHGDLSMEPTGPAGPHSGGDTLGGAQAPTGNDGAMGDDAPAGDAGLTDSSLGDAALPGGADTPRQAFGDEDLDEEGNQR
ncbi:hypothetical protein [Ruicaihuangia caeni]|uniref:hypothetical protein n=1 Tax=Ruicaihuangia caeni TaxID=3042517 RepID=UPI0033906587